MKRLFRRLKYMLKAGHLVDVRGLTWGFSWTYDGTGFSSKTMAQIAGYHPRNSLTWRWALYWRRPRGLKKPHYIRYDCGPRRDHGYWDLELPLVGAIAFRWQPVDNLSMRGLAEQSDRTAGFTTKGPYS